MRQKRVYWRLLRRKLRKYLDVRSGLRRILHLRGSPHSIALSFAIGMYIGFIPLLGVQTFLALILSWILRLNAVAMVSAAYFTNPLTFVPLFWMAFKVGMLLYPSEVSLPANWTEFELERMFELLSPYLVQLIIGTTVLGLIFAGASYVFVKYLVTRYRKLYGGPHE